MNEILKCPVCSSEKLTSYLKTKDYFFTNEDFTLSKCGKCGFVFTNPIPSIEDIGKYYETENYLSHDSSNKGIIGSIYNTVREINLNDKFKIVSKYKNTGSILDIGCGTGELLNYFKSKQWKTKGIEPNKSARDFASKNYDINIGDEPELGKINNMEFDVVSMWHVLEHVYDLRERMNAIVSILKDDGVIIIALPMIDSPDSIKFGKYWAGLDVPRHLYHFSTRSFELLANKHKLNIVGKYPMKFDSFYVSWLSHKAKKNSLSFVRGVADGFISNARANKTSNYSSMIFVLKKDL